MALKIKPRNRYSTGLPDPSVLDTGELWINAADKTIGIKDNQDQIVVLADLTKSVADTLYLGVDASAQTANKLATAQTISIAGDATGSASFDGSAPVSISITLSSTGVTAQAYGQEDEGQVTFGQQLTIPNITVDAKGRITNAKNAVITLPAAPTDITGNAGTATALQNVRYLSGMAFNGNDDVTWYGSCSSPADSAAKTASIQHWGLYVGSVCIITFVNGNSAANPTLNINEDEARPIMNTGVALGNLSAGTTLLLVYDGTYYQVVGGGVSGVDYSQYYTKEEMDAKFLPIMKPSAKGTVSIYAQTEAAAQPVVEAYNAAKQSAAQNTGALNCYTKEEADALFATIVNPVIIDTLTVEDGEVTQ